MTITIREITKENYRAACKLKVGSGQEHFVATNAVSIADSKFHPSWQCFGIYADGQMVGFLMHGPDDEGQQWIIRLMVDETQQGHGYGRAAMELILARFGADPACAQVAISYEPENVVAQKLYASFGFVETGEVEEGETVARLDFKR